MNTKGINPMSNSLPMWEILVPYKIGKKTVLTPYHQEWDAKVIEIAGGLTIMRATKGC